MRSADGTHRSWIPVETSWFSARPVDDILPRHMERNLSLSVPAQVIFSSWPREPMKDPLIVREPLVRIDEGTDGFIRRRLAVVPKIAVKCALEIARSSLSGVKCKVLFLHSFFLNSPCISQRSNF